uniref:Ovule protein n=1 Tax=Caenorhabditis tropicalis TaxID=1561998 RepID=A0A1I7UG30_9PELO
MLRRIKRFFGLSAHSYFPNNEVAPTPDGSILSTMSRKSTKSERKAAKKDKKKKSPLADTSAPAIFHVATKPSDIVIGGEDTVPCSESETDRQTVITDSLPYRDPSDKVYLDFNAVPMGQEGGSSTQSIVGSDSIKSRLESIATDGASSAVTLPNVESRTESVYSGDFSQDTDSQNSQMCDSKSRELPVDCDILNDKPMMTISPIPSRVSTTSSVYMGLPKMENHEALYESLEKSEDISAMKKFNDELDVSTARLPPMLKELPPRGQDDSMLSGNDEFSDSKNNSVARILNESHEAMMRSPENKHLRSCGY